MHGGSITNTGGYTQIGTNTLTNVTITNNGDGGGHRGHTNISGAFTATGTTINNYNDNVGLNGTQGYTEFWDGSSMTAGTINNNGGSTVLGHTTGGNVTLANATITNSVDAHNRTGSTEAKGIVIADNATIITNQAADTSNRSFTRITNTMTGGIINNEGGYTWVGSAGTLRSSVHNKIGTGNVPGYLSVHRGTLTLDNTSPLGIDLNSTTNGFVFLYGTGGTTVDVRSGVLNLYLDTSTTYTNVTRSLIYKGVDGADTSSLTGEFPTVSWKDTNGNAIAVQATLNYAPDQTPQTAPAGLVDVGGTPYLNVIPLLQVTFSYPPSLSATTQRQVKSFENNTREMGTQLVLATQQLARAVMDFVGRKNFSNRGATYGGEVETMFSSSNSPSLSITEGMMRARAEENLEKMSLMRTSTTGLWVQPFGHLIEQRDQGSTKGYNGTMTGLMAGLDHTIGDTLVGMGIGSSLATSELNGNGGKTKITNKFLVAFSKHTLGDWELDGVVTLSANRFRAGRALNTNTLASNAHDGYQVVPSVGVRYKTQWSGLELSPYLTATFLSSHEHGYTESGAGVNNLTVKARTASQLQGETGINLAKRYEHSFGQGTYGASVGVLVSTPWKKGAINGSVVNTGFGVESNETTSTHGVLKLSSQFDLPEDWYLSFIYGGEFGNRYQAHEGGITFRRMI